MYNIWFFCSSWHWRPVPVNISSPESLLDHMQSVIDDRTGHIVSNRSKHMPTCIHGGISWSIQLLIKPAHILKHINSMSYQCYCWKRWIVWVSHSNRSLRHCSACRFRPVRVRNATLASPPETTAWGSLYCFLRGTHLQNTSLRISIPFDVFQQRGQGVWRV